MSIIAKRQALTDKKLLKKQWKDFLKKEEYIDYLAFYKSMRNVAQGIMLQMIDFLFIEDVYVAFLELLELNNNIDIMLSTKSYETMKLSKQRVDFLLQEKAENWYL